MYRRSTRETKLAELAAPIRDALNKHAGGNQLVLAPTVRVWITHSENPPADGFFGKLFSQRANSADPDAAHDTVVVLHSSHLVIVTSGEKRGTTALSVPLAIASVSREHAIAAKLGVPGAKDGVHVSGFPGELGRPGTLFVGLGPEPAGAECEKAIEAAIVAAKN